MSLTKQEFSDYIKNFRFRELFNEMGWNNDRTKVDIIPDENVYQLQSVAEKSGFKILICPPDPEGKIPGYNIRKKIETKVTKLFQEHLIIYQDAKQSEQIWQLVVRQSGKPAKMTETRYSISQDPELLYQRASGLFFELDEEENITIVDVTQRVAENFHQNAEKVTKKFYERFKKEHTSFLDFIKGIEKKVDRDWYASLMLNRLMFCYFIQKKGFLDDNRNYLREKLNVCQEKKGKNKFYSFYRDFLLVLFHEGLNRPDHGKEVQVEIGKIPYLNGGLFDEHELEKQYDDIDIDDNAFERVFDFFDQYEWHLDTRVKATGKDINPDVIGYIFEKYINDRAQMGAYYTKEDITDYISKNCIIPWLFDETKRNYPKALNADGEIWQSLKESGDDYIYDAVKHGVPEQGGLFDDLPDEIKEGFRPELEKQVVKNDGSPHLYEIRKPWNKTAPSNIALPTEIYREVIERRKRYTEVKSKIEKGEIAEINDFITYNLNIRQFAQDVVKNTEDPDFLRHFFKALNSVSILDPTCGSGAFLFAAMGILEPLYEACLTRMRGFTEEEDRENENENKKFSNKYKFFRDTLAETQNEQHPNLQYYIYKSIILRNLYGVDIMKEAVEIAKLRLFLKLVATVDADYRKPNLGLEPLPDIDFNIRAGNTLVGFATEDELMKGLEWTFDGQIVKPQIEEKCDIVARTYKRYKEIQLTTGNEYKDFVKAKEELQKRLKELNHELNDLLHKQASGIKYETWLENYQPFHWFAEFYEIMQNRGGFDVIIGNPPYVQYSENKFNYRIREDLYETFKSGNLYSFVYERSQLLLTNLSRSGLIVQISCLSTPAMETMRKRMTKHNSFLYVSNYATRPAFLFEGVTMNLTIILNQKKINSKPKIFASNYLRWINATRKYLFESIPYSYTLPESIFYDYSLPKLSIENENRTISKVVSVKETIGNYLAPIKRTTPQQIYYRTAGGRYFKIFLDRDFGSESKSNKSKYFDSETNVYEFIAVLSSNLWWWWYTLHFDMYNCKDYMMYSFPYQVLNDDFIIKLGEDLCYDLVSNADRKIQNYETTGSREQLIFSPSKSKYIIDKIDIAIASHYSFTEKELDFIINYDIKYRMGKELMAGEEEDGEEE